MTKLLAIIKRLPVLSHLLLYLWQKRHNGDKVKFWFSSHISYRCKFEGMNMVAQKSSYFGSMGYGSYVGHECNVSADIGRFTSVGPHCTFINGQHAYKAPMFQHLHCSSRCLIIVIHKIRRLLKNRRLMSFAIMTKRNNL